MQKLFIKLIRILLSLFFFYTGLLVIFRHFRPRKGILILTYHRINETGGNDPLNMTISPADFDRHLRYLKDNYHVISLTEAISRLEDKKSILANSVVITFDDGYIDNYLQAYPILKKYDLPATIFLATSPIDKGKRLLWYDEIKNIILGTSSDTLLIAERSMSLRSRVKKEKAIRQVIEYFKEIDINTQKYILDKLRLQLSGNFVLPEVGEMLSWEQIREMKKNGISFGAHTKSHPILTRIPIEQARMEIEESKRRIGEELGEPVEHFAYPNGGKDDFDENIVSILQKAGFKSACTLIPGENRDGDLFRLKRIGIDQAFVGCNGLFTKQVFASEIAGLFDFLLLRTWRAQNG